MIPSQGPTQRIMPSFAIHNHAGLNTCALKTSHILEAINRIRKILLMPDFQKDEKAFFESCSIDVSDGGYDPNRDLYFYNPVESFIMKYLKSYINGEEDLISRLESKIAVQNKANQILQTFKQELRNIDSTGASQSEFVITYIDNLNEKKDKAPEEMKVLQVLNKIFPLELQPIT